MICGHLGRLGSRWSSSKSVSLCPASGPSATVGSFASCPSLISFSFDLLNVAQADRDWLAISSGSGALVGQVEFCCCCDYYLAAVVAVFVLLAFSAVWPIFSASEVLLAQGCRRCFGPGSSREVLSTVNRLGH